MTQAEMRKAKTDEMRGLLRALQRTSWQLQQLPEEVVTGAQAPYVRDGQRLDIVEQLSEMAERLQLGDVRERNIRPWPVRMVTAWAPNPFMIRERPEDSTTEVAFYNLDANVPKERIAALLGGAPR